MNQQGRTLIGAGVNVKIGRKTANRAQPGAGATGGRVAVGECLAHTLDPASLIQRQDLQAGNSRLFDSPYQQLSSLGHVLDKVGGKLCDNQGHLAALGLVKPQKSGQRDDTAPGICYLA